MRVGDPVWRLRDRWTANASGRWEALAVIGETSRSFIVGVAGSTHELAKLSKAVLRDGACPDGWAISEEQVERDAWVHEHAYRITELAGRVADYETLREIAALINYDDKTKQRRTP